MNTPNPPWDYPTEPIPPAQGWVAPPPPARRGLPAWAVLSIIAGALFLFGGIPAIVVASAGSAPKATPVAEKEPLTETTTTAPATKAAKPAPTKAAPAAPKIGTPFRAGDFQYTVHSKKCGISEVGGPYLKTKAQGSFCRLDVTAKNVTKSSHMFDAESTVTVADTEGRKFSADSEAGIYGNEGSAGWLDQVNPGSKIRAFIFFDVASGVRLVSATFSAGVLTMAEDVTVKF